MKRELSDRLVLMLLIIAVVVSLIGACIVYDYSHSYSGEKEIIKQSSSTGYVSLNVVDNEMSEEKKGDVNENI